MKSKNKKTFNVVQLDLSSLHPRKGKYDQILLALKMNYRATTKSLDQRSRLSIYNQPSLSIQLSSLLNQLH